MGGDAKPRDKRCVFMLLGWACFVLFLFLFRHCLNPSTAFYYLSRSLRRIIY